MAIAVEYEKKSVTIPKDVVDSVDAVLGSRSFSGYVTEALRRQVRRDNLAQLVRELTAAGGAITPEEYRRALEELTA